MLLEQEETKLQQVRLQKQRWRKQRNGHSIKTVKTSAGEVEIAVPRDRKAEFEPQIIRKNETSIS